MSSICLRSIFPTLSDPMFGMMIQGLRDTGALLPKVVKNWTAGGQYLTHEDIQDYQIKFHHCQRTASTLHCRILHSLCALTQ